MRLQTLHISTSARSLASWYAKPCINPSFLLPITKVFADVNVVVGQLFFDLDTANKEARMRASYANSRPDLLDSELQPLIQRM
jgi:hypothetical protein